MMLHSIVKAFFPHKIADKIEPYGKGHINNTYKVEWKGDDGAFILQQINTNVFPQPGEIAKTHMHLQRVFDGSTLPVSIARLIPTHRGDNLFTDPNGGIWRMTTFIAQSYSVEVVAEHWQAWEAGHAFGAFARACSTLDHNNFAEPIKDFHRLSFRLQQLNDAIGQNKANRLGDVLKLVTFYKERAARLSVIEALSDQGIIPVRIVHNDTKINNLLFRDKKAVAIIDLDTTGPGLIYYDYGDAIRTGANTAEEDEPNPHRVDLNIQAFEAFTNGYVSQVRPIMTTKETEYFFLAPLLMTCIMGIRFLTDYLNGDCYYKINYPDHNLVRSTVQKAFIESMEKRTDEMKHIINSAMRSQ